MMKLSLQVYVDADDALVLWSADQLDPKMRGFAVERERKPSGGGPTESGWLDNLASPGEKPYQQGVRQPSNEWPFRAFVWTDHSVSEGDDVRYRVVPVLWGEPARESAPDDAGASDWSSWRSIGYPADSVYLRQRLPLRASTNTNETGS